MEDLITPIPRPFWIAGSPQEGTDTRTITHPRDGSEVATVGLPDADQAERAVAAADTVASELANSRARRVDALEIIGKRLAEQTEEAAELITAETGKPLRLAESEVADAVSIFRVAAEQARWLGRIDKGLPTDSGDGASLALTRRAPIGPVLGVPPSGLPLAAPAHKIASSLAVGAPIITAPQADTPLSALLLGELLSETDLPAGSFSIIPLERPARLALLSDQRIPVVSFTGSASEGLSLLDSAPRKNVIVEAGGNASVVVLADWPEHGGAARAIAAGLNAQCSRSSVSVQRVFVDKAIAEAFTADLIDAVRSLRSGDPYDPNVDIADHGDCANSREAAEWVRSAVRCGANLCTGGPNSEGSLEPTVITDVPPNQIASAPGLAGPLLVVSAIDSPEQAVKHTADSQCDELNVTAHRGPPIGVFTRDIGIANRMCKLGKYAGVIVGDVPSYRTMGLPGAGIAEAMTELTEQQFTVLTNVNY